MCHQHFPYTFGLFCMVFSLDSMRVVNDLTAYNYIFMLCAQLCFNSDNLPICIICIKLDVAIDNDI